MKRTIVYICNDLTNTGGGVRTFIELLTGRLSEEYAVQRISLLGMSSKYKVKGYLFLNQKNLFDETLISARALKRIIDQVKNSDIVHFNNIFTFSSLFLFVLVNRYNKNSIITFHGMFCSHSRNPLRYVIDFARSFLIVNIATLLSARIVFLTKAQRKEASDFCLFRKRLNKKSSIINNFINEEMISTKKQMNNPPNVLYVGRYSRSKGFYDLIDATEGISDISFSFVGGNKEFSNKSNLRSFGLIENKEIVQFYDQNDILILPSHTESFGLVIIEAMARGLAVLASDLPAIREYLTENKNCYLFPPGDIERIRKLMRYLKDNPHQLERISKNNLKNVWRFTAEKKVPEYIKIYECVLKGKNELAV